MQNFWEILPKPFFALAPLADVTDAAFRRVIAKYSKPHGPQVMYTEFVSADGLVLAPEEGKAKLMRDLVYTPEERPIVAQFFTATPEHMEKAAALAEELGFDGVDINMGCPHDAVVAQGAGAALIKNSALAIKIIEAAQKGAPTLPVSVKTRLGYNEDTLEEWLPMLLSAKPVAVTIHARTRKEMSSVPAHWERVRRAVEIRDELRSDTLILGNGDVRDIEDAHVKAKESRADGIMLGRAIFGKPWLFANAEAKFSEKIVWPESPGGGNTGDPRTFSKETLPEQVMFQLHVLVEHTKLFEELLGDVKNFAIMKKHFKAYAEGFPGAKELRVKLMEAESAQDVEKIVEDFLAASQ